MAISDDRAMSTRERPVDRGTARARRILADLGRELRAARRDRGLSQEAVGRAVGVSGVTVGRIERDLAPRASVVLVARLLEAVGLELSARAFPGGRPIRDDAQLTLLERFRLKLHRSLRWQTEAPLPIVGDQRAWDGLIVGDGWRIGVEAETAPHDAQALVRRLALKARDGRVDGVILVLPRTRRARDFVRDGSATLAPSFPGSGTRTLELLAAGTRPPESAIVSV
jgi:transcriptional regulator with XRE-family HTH domain